MSREPFLVYVHPQFRVDGCATKRAEESRGLFGFHSFTRCPACQVVPETFELWGCNGHRQGGIPVDGDLGAFLEHRAAMRNERFEAGAAIHYAGRTLDAVGPKYGIPEREES